MRMLFITANRLGDAVMTTGLYDAFARTAPDIRAWVAAGPIAAPIFAATPGVERIHVLRKQPRKRHWIELYRAAGLKRWDLIVDLRDSAVSRLLPFARRRIIVGQTPKDRHRVAALSEAVGLCEPAPPQLRFGPEQIAEAERRIPPGAPTLAIAPGANWPGKRWRPQFFAELVRRTLGRDGPFAGGRLAVFGGDEDRAAAEPSLAALPCDRIVDLIGALDPLTAGACLARCAAFVGNDSGLGHLAAAAGAPTLSLFGPGHASVYRPWGRHAHVCRSQIAEDDINRRRWAEPEALGALMDGLTVSAAERALIALAAGAPDASAAAA